MAFDPTPVDRSNTQSIKWERYGPDVLPMWVADMDFRSPEPVIRALEARARHGVFGYTAEPSELREVIVQRLWRRFRWAVKPEEIVFLSGVVAGFNLACQTIGTEGDGVLLQTPVYYPMLDAPKYAKRQAKLMTLTRRGDGSYIVDLDRMKATIDGRTRLFMLCNPHNPVGRVYTRRELEEMAKICLHHNLMICSDEIHCDLVYPQHAHTPIASLDREIAERTITLMAPSKTYNIPGLGCAFAIIPNRELRQAYERARRGLVSRSHIMGYVAALAAYREGETWERGLMAYLKENRDLVVDYVRKALTPIRCSPPEGTYLAWLDCRQLGIEDPQRFFLERACVALNDGAAFGPGGEGFVRLNFGCPREMLLEALNRMRVALERG